MLITRHRVSTEYMRAAIICTSEEEHRTLIIPSWKNSGQVPYPSLEFVTLVKISKNPNFILFYLKIFFICK